MRNTEMIHWYNFRTRLKNIIGFKLHHISNKFCKWCKAFNKKQIFICTFIQIAYKWNSFDQKTAYIGYISKQFAWTVQSMQILNVGKMIKIAFTWIFALNIKLITIPHAFQWSAINFILIGNCVCKTVYLYVSNVNQALSNFPLYFFFI